MPLSPGEKLGPRRGWDGRSVSRLDTRLRRDVAIEVTAERFSERFETEARAIGSLNHPNVCTLHDVGPNYLVMELVEGETMAERIEQGAIPLDEALAIARQLADALEAAHEKGITHRDLKPGNIKIMPDGTVRVLDFGLAKMGGTAAAQSTNSPTITTGATQAGAKLTTVCVLTCSFVDRLHTTRRSLLRTALSLPSLALTAQEPGDWRARCRSYLETASKVGTQPLWELHAEWPKLPAAQVTGGEFAAPFLALDTVYRQLAKLAIGETIDSRTFDSVFEYLASRKDLVDFIMSAMIRLLYLYGNDSRIPDDLKRRMEEAVLDFRPWLYPEDPPVNTVSVYWTENHEALYSSIEYLAGQRYPGKTFRWLGKPGAWHMEHGRKNLLVWCGLRSRFGMSEWLSPGYYSEDIIALMNVVDFGRDPAVVNGASGLMEILLLDLALHSFDGGLRATAGRSYLDMLKDGRRADTGAVVSLAFGIDSPVRPPLSGSGIAIATSPGFRTPEAIVRIAHARPREVVIREKSGFSPEEAVQLGFHPDDLADIMTYWTLNAFTYPPVFRGSQAAFRKWNVDRSVESWDAMEQAFRRAGGDPAKVPDRTPSALFGADIETYRTPDYQVSTAQDYRKGKPGYQQQIFLASLGGAASVWTNHPGSDTDLGRPSYWAGNGCLPRAAQHRNLVLVLYRIPPANPRPFSHAYFPASEFDEVKEGAGWVFGRKGDGYIALTASPRMEHAGVERIAKARESAWVCRLGRKAVDGSFAGFAERLAKSSIEFAAGRISFTEPGGPKAAFGWDEDLVVNGRKIPLHDYPRYDTPFINTARGEQVYRIACEGRTHTIDLSAMKVRPFRDMT